LFSLSDWIIICVAGSPVMLGDHYIYGGLFVTARKMTMVNGGVIDSGKSRGTYTPVGLKDFGTLRAFVKTNETLRTSKSQVSLIVDAG
jgi:hypothetical protein